MCVLCEKCFIRGPGKACGHQQPCPKSGDLPAPSHGERTFPRRAAGQSSFAPTPQPPTRSEPPGDHVSCQSISCKPSPRFLSSSICLLLCPARPRRHPLPRRRASRPQWTRGSCSEATASPEGRAGILPLPRISSHIWHLPHGACDLTFSAIAFP